MEERGGWELIDPPPPLPHSVMKPLNTKPIYLNFQSKLSHEIEIEGWRKGKRLEKVNGKKGTIKANPRPFLIS